MAIQASTCVFIGALKGVSLGGGKYYTLWFAKTLADCEINDIAALPPLFCYNS
jgi:hypothetical protein